MPNYRLVALDIDGTLFNNKSQITPKNLHAIRRITDAGVQVILSTGRPFGGLPFEQLKDSGIDYAITANGSGIYQISTCQCLSNEAMDEHTIMPILDFLMQKNAHMVAFIDGKGYLPVDCIKIGQKLQLPDELKNYVTNTRIPVDNLAAFIHENAYCVQKMTLNFYPDENGILVDREEIRQYLEQQPAITCVCGGYNNLEFTRSDVSKGAALYKLAASLGISPKDTIAIGDTENDISILEAAGVGVAMENATPAVKERADYITTSNEDDGVAAAIYHFFPELF